MKVYDTHSDIFYNLAFRDTPDPFKEYHLDDLQKGGVVGGIWVVYSDCEFDVIKAYKEALAKYEPYKDKFDVIYGMEGLRNVKNLKEFDELYQMGIRHAMLTWNEENHLATGVKAISNNGLKEEGKEFIKYMNEHHMIVDVSHLNVQSFYDVVNEKPEILIASHSNAYALSDHPRNLTDDQLRTLKEAGGMVGVVAARNFVSKDPKKQNCAGLVEQIKYIADIIGIDNVMLGLDMMHYLDDFNDANLDDLKCHADVPNIIEAMKKSGMSEKDIEKVCYLNFKRLKKKVYCDEGDK